MNDSQHNEMPDAEPTPQFTSDIGRFGMIPEWVLDADVSDAAIRLYCVLMAKHADRHGGDTVVKRATLADEMHKKSRDPIDKAKAELMAIGALVVTPRHGADGSRLADQITVVACNPHLSRNLDTPAVKNQQGGPSKVDSKNQNQLNQKVSSNEETMSVSTLFGSDNGDGPDLVQVIFDHWVKVMGKTAGAKLTDARRSKIKARLKKYPLEDIIAAIDNCRSSAFHMGDNDGNTLHNDLTLICRSDDKLEWFRDSIRAGRNGKKDRHRLGQVTIDADAVYAKGKKKLLSEDSP